ncbi:nucleoside deaminase [Uniformispora flossi]|uniref:nucleoside deaminase n=1 Tax=Uniformispora flossi TaxID=3390723 RepID=UPI003C2D42E6
MVDGFLTGIDRTHLARAVELAAEARDGGNHPFGAVLAGADGNVLAAARNSVGTTGDVSGHAETNLVRIATTRVDAELLPGSTLYTSCEPCAMCAGAIYWSGIGRVVFALSEADLYVLTGDDARNPTLKLPCRTVFAAGSRPITVVGPVDVPGMRDVHQGFWQGPSSAHRSAATR